MTWALSIFFLAQASAAEAVIVRGQVELISNDGLRSLPVVRGTPVKVGDLLKTGDRSGVRLLMIDKTIVELAENTSLVVQEYEIDPKRRRRKASLKLSLGRVWARVSGWFGGSNRYEIEAPNAVAGVRGTEFIMQTSASGETQIDLKVGSLELSDTERQKILAQLESLSRVIAGVDAKVTVKPITDGDWATLTGDFDLGFGISEEELAQLNELGSGKGKRKAPAGFGDFMRPSMSPVSPTLPLEPGVGFGSGRSTVTTEVRND